MRAMRAIYKKELTAYYNTLSGYLFIGLYLIGGGALFIAMNLSGGSAKTSSAICCQQYVLFFTLPLLTLRFQGRGKDRILLSAPVNAYSIIMGRFLSAITVFLIALAISFIYPLILAVSGAPAWGEIASGYMGLILLGSAVIALGMFLSSVCSYRLAAGAATYGVILLILFLQATIPGIGNQWLRTALIKTMPSYHLYSFESGMPGLLSFVYFLSLTTLLLFLSARVFEQKRWS